MVVVNNQNMITRVKNTWGFNSSAEQVLTVLKSKRFFFGASYNVLIIRSFQLIVLSVYLNRGSAEVTIKNSIGSDNVLEKLSWYLNLRETLQTINIIQLSVHLYQVW